MPIYAKREVILDIKSRFDYAFARNKYPGAPSFLPIEIEDEPFIVKTHKIVPIRVSHGGLKVLGFRVNDFAYLTDIKSIETSEVEKLRGVNKMVVSALHHEVHHSHFNLQEALNFISEVNPEKAYLTHICLLYTSPSPRDRG